MKAQSIDEVITQLRVIIAKETINNSPMAFFPVLYLTVTERIKNGILKQEFEDNPRMEKLDILFANRYIEAYNLEANRENPTQSWKNAFEASKKSNLIIMQHLLLGINAHINLDLGIAVAETVGEDGDLSNIENDFNKINAILASMINDVQERIEKVSPLFYLLEKIGKGKEDKIVSFSINVARDGAWLFANQYHLASNKAQEIISRDECIGLLATKLISSKSWILRTTIKTIRFFETKDSQKVIEVLKA
jgi:hypothetical protein